MDAMPITAGSAIKAKIGGGSMTGYPEVPEAVALKLMERIERAEQDRRTRNRSTRADCSTSIPNAWLWSAGKRSADYRDLLH
jgi:hypothetical protein